MHLRLPQVKSWGLSGLKRHRDLGVVTYIQRDIMAGDDHPDFKGYMEALANKATKAAVHASQTQSHEEWLETSWGGYVVKTLRRVGDNKFIHALAEAFTDQEHGESTNAVLLRTFARMAIVIMAIFSFYVIGKLLEMLIGKEIVIEQDVIIIEEVRQSDLKKKGAGGSNSTKKGEPAQTLRRRNAREKIKTDDS